jgi:deoxyribonuclease (pyrimidine dimer)
MTRINAGIPPRQLSRQHLIAEHREIVRIPNTIKSGKANISGIPEQFTLGKGHVKFFYNKLRYLHKRYEQLYKECMKRGYNMTYFGKSFEDLPPGLYHDYKPTKQAIALILERIKERSGGQDLPG